MSDDVIERSDQWLDALADYLSREAFYTTDKTVPHGESTVEGLHRAAREFRGVVEENEQLREGGKQLDGVIRRLVDENEQLREGLCAALEYLELVPDGSIDYEATLIRVRGALGEPA